LILVCSPASDPRQSKAIHRDHAAATDCACSSIHPIPLDSLPRPSSVARFAPWRSRLKSVLEETSSKVVDQFDLGPAILPTGVLCCRSVKLIDHLPPTAPPLRC
jgi:hypothetical protein